MYEGEGNSVGSLSSLASGLFKSLSFNTNIIKITFSECLIYILSLFIYVSIGTDDGDLNFDYLSNFGPRFRKLADMYGEDPSDEESETYRNTHPESWC